MNGDARDELLVGYLELDLPEGERARLERLLESDSALSADLERLHALDRSLFQASEAAWRRSGLAGVRLDAARILEAERGGDALAMSAPRPRAPRAAKAPPAQSAPRSRWRALSQHMPLAAGLALVLLGASALFVQRETALGMLRAPRPVAVVADSNAAGIEDGSQVLSREEYRLGPGERIGLSLAERSNSLLYIEGPGAFRAADADTLRLEGGSLYLSLPSSERPFAIELPGGVRVEATRVVFELREDELRVKDGTLRLVRGSAPPLDLVVGQAAPAGAGQALPRQLSAREILSIGTWTGAMTVPERGAEGAEERSQAPALDSQTGTVSASALLSLLPGDAIGAMIATSGEAASAGFDGPLVAALLPRTRIPYLLTLSDDPRRAADGLLDLIGPVLSSNGVWTEDSQGLPYLKLARRPTATEPNANTETARLIVMPKGALLLPDGAVMAGGGQLARGVSLGDTLLGRELTATFSDVEPGQTAFVLDVPALLRRNGLARETVSSLSLSPGSVLSGTFSVRDGRWRLEASMPLLAPEGAEPPSEPTGPSPEALVELMPPDSAVAFALRAADGPALLALWQQLLLHEVYAGDGAALATQTADLEDRLGVDLATVAGLLDGSVAVSLAPGGDGAAEMLAMAGAADPEKLAGYFAAAALPRLLRPALDGEFLEAASGWRFLASGPLLLAGNAPARLAAVSGVPPAAGVDDDPGAFPVAAIRLASAGGEGDAADFLRVVLSMRSDSPALGVRADAPGTREALESALSSLGLPAQLDLDTRRNARSVSARLDEAAEAIRRFGADNGRAPRDLAELAASGHLPYAMNDPFRRDGGPLSYRADPATGVWMLWSHGPDRTDDDGAIEWTEARPVSDPGDLVRRGVAPRRAR
ncbi:MAG: hypothetical protein SF028_06975 [Candidatus Sumerlaeia bacterium]|nr:hypothetical protein [Candidatus Sumerlaeia bacterium]